MKHLLLIIILFSSIAFAAPAFERTRTFTQPDGSTFQGSIKGDEYLNWTQTQTGKIVIFNKHSGQYEEAIITPDALKASGRMYHQDAAAAKARALSPSPKTKDALHQLWLKKRGAEMRRRGLRNE